MNSLLEVIKGANLFNGSNYSYVPDRFCSPNSAIYFNKGYLQVPSGVYFSVNFTFTAWIYFKSYQSWSRIIDFGNGQNSDNVGLTLLGATSQISGFAFKGSNLSIITTLSPSIVINLNQWYFVTFVLNSTTGYIYVNGNQIANGTLYVPNNIIRTSNYIGKSNMENPNADAIYDEIQIYRGGLSLKEIMKKYIASSNNGIF
jgi:hypothetical protein